MRPPCYRPSIQLPAYPQLSRTRDPSVRGEVMRQSTTDVASA